MPGGDGTGPGGMGPMTGRAAGYCAGYPIPGFMNPIGGRGHWGWGRGGGGWGRRNWFYATGLTGSQRAMYGYPAYGGAPPYGTPYGYAAYGSPSSYGASYGAPYGMPYGAPFGPTMTAHQELDGLKGQAEYFEDALDGIKKRIGELEAEGKEK